MNHVPLCVSHNLTNQHPEDIRDTEIHSRDKSGRKKSHDNDNRGRLPQLIPRRPGDFFKLLLRFLKKIRYLLYHDIPRVYFESFNDPTA
jgi:hypothetical protein